MSEIPATPAAVFIVYHMCNPRGLPPIIFNGLGMPVPFFFFQAEDGIRAIGVTGVQTCALPISYDIEATAAAIARAFAMPLDERKERWNAMMTALRANSVYDWASHFLGALAGENEAGEFDKPMDNISL